MQDTKITDVSREPARELEKAPQLLEYVAPSFAPGAPSIQTDVSLDLFIGPDGDVWCAEHTGDGTSPLYVERALAAARQFKFEPATLDGAPTATWFPFVIEFR